MVGPCSCGLFSHCSLHHGTMFPYTNAHNYDYDTAADVYSPSSPGGVDCTLSLGTPSTRLGGGDVVEEKKRSSPAKFRWGDMFGHSSSKSSSSSSSAAAAASNGGGKGRHGGNGGGYTSSGGGAGGDPLLARRCANCDTTSTPLWRNGPRGPKSLCNACGIRFKKEERRATAAATTGSATNATAAAVEAHHHLSYYNNNGPWAYSQKQYFSPNEFRFIEDSDCAADSAAGLPFLSWRLNVADRTSGLVHDFTR